MIYDALIIIGSICAAILFLVVATRTYDAPKRKEANDFTGAVVAVIGTTYAVILAFVLSNVWGLFREAKANEEKEANALVNVWRLAEQVPQPAAKEIRAACVKYAEDAVNKDWPAMAAYQLLPPESHENVDWLWKLVGQSQSHSGDNSIAISQMVEELRLLTQYRRIRIMHSQEAVPDILKAVLLAGGVITVAAACLFGVPSFQFHVLQVGALSFLISLVLVAVADIDRPYQGPVRVEPNGFMFSLRTFARHPD